MKLSVIIVNFNVKYFLEQCLSSVTKACKNIESEIFVMDNKSTDGSREFFMGRFHHVTFLWSSENAGFSKANNLALQQASGEYILFLNPDTILPEDCLDKSLAFFRDKNDIGAIGVRMIDGSGNFLKESKRGLPSPSSSLYKLSGLTAVFPSSKIFARYYLGHLDQNKNHEVDILAGAFMMIKKNVLDKTGSFDERFFLYGEDVDLSYRIQKAGFKNYYFSETTVIHFKGESMQRGSLDYVRLFYGAMSQFVKKHYSSSYAGIYHFLIRVAIWLKASLSFLFHIFRQLCRYGKKAPLKNRCFIVADKNEFDFIRRLLQNTHLRSEVIGRIDTELTAGQDAMGNLSQLPALVAKYRVNEIIFCANGFRAKEMIALIQQLPPAINYRFHFKGTSSIVGSKHKKKLGDYIAVGVGD